MKLSLLLISFCSLVLADQKPSDIQIKHAGTAVKPSAVRTAADATSGSAPVTSSKYEYYTNVVIPAGQTVNLDSTLDYSSSDTIRITMRSTNSDLGALLGTAYFTVPNATEFLTQEAFYGSDFFYGNSGGVTVQVCGSQFRLALTNGSKSTVTLSSVLLYTHQL